jgi:FixJ family two-component response regulator
MPQTGSYRKDMGTMMEMQTTDKAEVFIVDDDPTVRECLAAMFTDANFGVKSFADGESFVAEAQWQKPSCVILDIYMPGRSGLDILRDIDARNYPAPILIATGRGDIPLAVEAIKRGAYDFIDKRNGGDETVERVRRAVDRWAENRKETGPANLRFAFPGHELLTPREREVLVEIAAGATSKEAAITLGISWRTVEIHRGHIMRKLQAKNAIDLARKVLRTD